MEHLKTYEGFLSKKSPDDKIAMRIINRLRKVKKESPYRIEELSSTVNGAGELYRYKIYFDDFTMLIKKAKFNEMNSERGRELNLSKRQINFPKWFPIYKITIDCTGDWEILKPRYSYQKELFELAKKVHKQDIEWRRINKIESEMNPEADLLENKVI